MNKCYQSGFTAITPNPALQPTGYSKLRLLPPSAELERWALTLLKRYN